MIAMIIGRIGSLTFILALRSRAAQTEKVDFSYPEERIILS
jgi:Trk-type K+ transport system membrane component